MLLLLLHPGHQLEPEAIAAAAAGTRGRLPRWTCCCRRRRRRIKLFSRLLALKKDTSATTMNSALLLLVLLQGVFGQHGGCPESHGVQTYPNEQHCDKFYKCENGTLTEETCGNGLVYNGYGNVHNHCNYNWAVDCEKRIYDDTPISSPGCLYQYGIYPVGAGCQTTFFKCDAGVAYETPCQRGLSYSNEHHVCDYPDNVADCKGQSEAVIGFKCPAAHELPPNAVARRFLPYPRFPLPGDANAYIVCVEDQPRVQYCGDSSFFDEATLGCIYAEEEHPHQQQHALPPPHLG